MLSAFRIRVDDLLLCTAWDKRISRREVITERRNLSTTKRWIDGSFPPLPYPSSSSSCMDCTTCWWCRGEKWWCAGFCDFPIIGVTDFKEVLDYDTFHEWRKRLRSALKIVYSLLYLYFYIYFYYYSLLSRQVRDYLNVSWKNESPQLDMHSLFRLITSLALIIVSLAMMFFILLMLYIDYFHVMQFQKFFYLKNVKKNVKRRLTALILFSSKCKDFTFRRTIYIHDGSVEYLFLFSDALQKKIVFNEVAHDFSWKTTQKCATSHWTILICFTERLKDEVNDWTQCNREIACKNSKSSLQSFSQFITRTSAGHSVTILLIMAVVLLCGVVNTVSMGWIVVPDNERAKEKVTKVYF